MQIWEWAEVGHQEYKSSELLKKELMANGFTIKSGVAAGGTSIGLKGTKLAAQVMADTVQDIFMNPLIIDSANVEYLERIGQDFNYYPLLGNRKPPLDYRK